MFETQFKRELHDLAQLEKHDDWTRLRHTFVAGDVESTDPGRENNTRPCYSSGVFHGKYGCCG